MLIRPSDQIRNELDQIERASHLHETQGSRVVAPRAHRRPRLGRDLARIEIAKTFCQRPGTTTPGDRQGQKPKRLLKAEGSGIYLAEFVGVEHGRDRQASRIPIRRAVPRQQFKQKSADAVDNAGSGPVPFQQLQRGDRRSRFRKYLIAFLERSGSFEE